MPSSNIIKLFLNNCEKLTDQVCFRIKKDNKWEEMSWLNVLSQIKELSIGLKKLGVSSGDKVAIISSTRYEWTIADMAILWLKGVTVPVYHSSSASEAEFILQDSEAKIAFVEEGLQFQKILSLLEKLPSLQKIVVICDQETFSDTKVMSFKQLAGLGRKSKVEDWEHLADSIDPEDLASIVYTSGTTGTPKGVLLSHGNILGEVEACKAVFPLENNIEGLFFLPLAHILARGIQFFQLGGGFIHCYAESIEKVAENLVETKPDFIVAVPRIFEKIYEKVHYKVRTASKFKQSLFQWAVQVGRSVSDSLSEGRPISIGLRAKLFVAKILVFNKILSKLGGRLRFAISGGAPLDIDLNRFFHGIGVSLLNGYGLTETCSAINCNSLENYKFGTVGKAFPGVEQKIAEDGEICVRGPSIFKGYFKREDATKEVMDSDGWFRTGDIGKIDEDGYLLITDRKKNIIVTASGKNISPQNIETLLMRNDLIEQAVVVGDNRKFLSAIFTLNQDVLRSCLKVNGIELDPADPVIHHPRIRTLVERAVNLTNSELASFESVRRFVILSAPLSLENGDLTPTLKVKRRIVAEKYKDLVDHLYSE